MMKCPTCSEELIIIQHDTPHPGSWGGYRLYGCKRCKRLVYEHLDEDTKEIQKRLDESAKQKIEEEKEKKKKDKETKRMLKNFDKRFPTGHIEDFNNIHKKRRKKGKWIAKPIYDPHHHHDNHLIN
jgi:hypothetical protein